jgi:hypothetical protein
MRSIMNRNDNACSAVGRTAGQRLSTAALMPIMAVMFIAVPVIGLAMPVHLDLGLSDFASGLASGSQFAASFLSRMWAGDWLRFISRARWSCLPALSLRLLTAIAPSQGVAPIRATDRR